MIQTNKPQLIDAKNGFEGIVYIRVANQTTTNNEVQFNIELFTIEHKESSRDKAILSKDNQLVFGKDGIPETEKERILVPCVHVISKEKAVFKPDTYYSKIGHLKPEEFDNAFINQMEFVNSFDWSKSDKTPVRYWNLTGKDMRIISEEEFKQLIAVKIIENGK